MRDRLYQWTYRWGFRAARLVWWVTRPSVRGALVAVRHVDRILLLRNSYRQDWTFPGGGIGESEAPLAAAVRELREEIDWNVTPAELREVSDIEFHLHNRNDKVTIFEMVCADLHKVRLDNREVVEARFVTRAEALAMPVLPHIRHYLETVWRD